MSNLQAGNMNVFPNRQALVEGACQRLTEAFQEAIERQGYCAVALSGGSTPRAVYERLGQEPYRSQIEWSKVHLFWGDERGVPPDHPDSNYRMVKEALLQRISIPEENIHRIPAERPPQEAAQLYEDELKKFFRPKMPVFDVVLLGLGTDGHTASLFPGTPAVSEREKWVTAVFVPQMKSWRITLTLPVINRARKIFFLVVGSSKAEIVRKLFHLQQPSVEVPASLVAPQQGELWWLVDGEAGGAVRQ